MLAHRGDESAGLDCEVADPFSAFDARWRACCSFRLGAGATHAIAGTAPCASERKRAHAFAEADEQAWQELSNASLVAQATELRARRVTVR
jgi:hypothetical protein